MSTAHWAPIALLIGSNIFMTTAYAKAEAARPKHSTRP